MVFIPIIITNCRVRRAHSSTNYRHAIGNKSCSTFSYIPMKQSLYKNLSKTQTFFNLTFMHICIYFELQYNDDFIFFIAPFDICAVLDKINSFRTQQYIPVTLFAIFKVKCVLNHFCWTGVYLFRSNDSLKCRVKGLFIQKLIKDTNIL
jgi:hypothetical protein